MERNQSLGELVAHAYTIEQQVIESGGELTPELERSLDLINEKLTVKVDHYVGLIEKTKHMAAYWANEAKTLSNISRSLKNFSDQLKERIKKAMLEHRMTEVSGDSKRFKLTNTKARLVIDDANLDPKYTMEVTTRVPDKERILDALEKGQTVKGACLQGGVALRSYANKGVK